MGCCCTFVMIGLVTLLAFLLKKIYTWFTKIPEVPTVDENYWWGSGEAKNDDDTSVKPFKINLSDKDLNDLKQRLSSSRTFTPALEGIQHQYGINSNLLKEVNEFWLNQYNWRERESFLNQYPQYTTKIQGLNICYIHEKPTETNGQKILPLLLLHGWPGSVREFYEVIPRLTKPSKERNFVFEVIVPHLPGFGFSEGAIRPGLNPVGIAIIFKELMRRLQFEQWYVQGGDFGSVVGTNMAAMFPKHILGLHLNMAVVRLPCAIRKLIIGSLCPSMIVSKKYRSKLYPLKTYLANLIRESGYLHIQATRPDTVGVALNDSPMGLAAYLLEKFIVATNSDYMSRDDGGLVLKFGYTKLLDNIMIYWITNSITTSVRLYAESLAKDKNKAKIEGLPVIVPTAYAYFGNDFFYTPRTLLKEKFKNVLQFTELPTGGHFAALEEPEMFADDVWSAVEKFQKYNKLS